MTPSADGLVCLTLDVDWAPEEALAEVLADLADAGLPATFFATHDSAVLRAAQGPAVEVGLHPDLTREPLRADAIVAGLQELYPDAVGVRSHGLVQSSRILRSFADRGLRYESNAFLWGHPHLRPVRRFADLWTIPFNWSDDKHVELGLPFRAEAMDLDAPGLKVLNFHPVHVFTNTTSEDHYAAFRAHTADPHELLKHRGNGAGVRTMFRETLAALSEGPYEVLTMSALVTRWAEQSA